jgi:F-type H+-transporting ATPase subunit epsilon
VAEPFNLKIFTPYRTVFDGRVEAIIVPGEIGELGVLAGHTRLLTTLVPGLVRWVEEGQNHVAAISGGFCEVFENTVVVLADTLERPHEIDVPRAERARDTARQALKRRSELGEREIARMEARLLRALNRLRAAKLSA